MSNLGKKYVVGIVGATGAVGVEIIKCLQGREFPMSELHLYSSAKSSGKVLATSLGEIIVEEYEVSHARLCDFLFLAVSGEFSLANAKLLVAGDGPIVIDNSSAWRYDAEVPLVVCTLFVLTNIACALHISFISHAIGS